MSLPVEDLFFSELDAVQRHLRSLQPDSNDSTALSSLTASSLLQDDLPLAIVRLVHRYMHQHNVYDISLSRNRFLLQIITVLNLETSLPTTKEIVDSIKSLVNESVNRWVSEGLLTMGTSALEKSPLFMHLWEAQFPKANAAVENQSNPILSSGSYTSNCVRKRTNDDSMPTAKRARLDVPRLAGEHLAHPPKPAVSNKPDATTPYATYIQMKITRVLNTSPRTETVPQHNRAVILPKTTTTATTSDTQDDCEILVRGLKSGSWGKLPLASMTQGMSALFSCYEEVAEDHGVTALRFVIMPSDSVLYVGRTDVRSFNNLRRTVWNNLALNRHLKSRNVFRAMVTPVHALPVHAWLTSSDVPTPNPAEASTKLSVRIQMDDSGTFSHRYDIEVLSETTGTHFFSWFAGRSGRHAPGKLKFTLKDALPYPKSYVIRAGDKQFERIKQDILRQCDVAQLYIPDLPEFAVLVTVLD